MAQAVTNCMQKFLTKIVFTGAAFAIIGLVASLPTVVQAAVPSEYQSCIPEVTAFKVTPLKLTKRDQAVTLSVTVQTNGCIIRGDVGEGSKWNVRAEVLDGDLKAYLQHDYRLPATYIRGSDFKRISNVVSSPNYNKYTATYTVTTSDVFKGLDNTTLALRANVWWDNERYKENSNFTTKITAPAATGATPTPSGVPKPNTNTGVIVNVDYDHSLGEFDNPLTLDTVPDIIAKVIRILLALVGMVAIVIIILSGFRMVAQGDNPAAVTKAKSAITWAIVGLITALLAFSIVSIIQRIIQR